MAFQVRDDILDIFADEKTLGKKVGKDIIEKKLGNAVVLLALEELATDDKKTIHSILNNKNPVTDKQEQEVLRLIQKTKAKENAAVIAENHVDKAIEELKYLPQNEWNELLGQLAKFVIEREK